MAYPQHARFVKGTRVRGSGYLTGIVTNPEPRYVQEYDRRAGRPRIGVTFDRGDGRESEPYQDLIHAADEDDA